MRFIVIAGGLVRADVGSEQVAYAEADSLVASGHASAEVFVRIGSVQRIAVQSERVPESLDEWLKLKTKEIGA